MRHPRRLDGVLIIVLFVLPTKCLRTTKKRSDLRGRSHAVENSIVGNPNEHERKSTFEGANSCMRLNKHKQSIVQLQCPQLIQTVNAIQRKLNVQKLFAAIGVASHAGVSVGDAVGTAAAEATANILSVENVQVTITAVEEGTAAVVSGVTDTAVAGAGEAVQDLLQPSNVSSIALQDQIMGTNSSYNTANKAWTVGSILFITAAVVADVLSGGVSGGAFTGSALTFTAVGGVASTLFEGIRLSMTTSELNNLHDCFNTICVFARSEDAFEIRSDVQTEGDNNMGVCGCSDEVYWFGSCKNPYGFSSTCTDIKYENVCGEQKAMFSDEILCKWKLNGRE